jgi:ligand-binding sensor domain-containing protein/two-component sensor histidine kinase
LDKKNLTYCFLFLISLVLNVTVNRAENISFKQIRIEDGLSQSTVFCILQDSKGYLWFGTANGLNRYDGYNFQIFSNNPLDSTTISDNGITAIHEDKQGYIWIGTAEGVLNRYDRRTGIFKRFHITEKLKITENPFNKYYEFPIPFSRNSDKTITAIAETPDNSIWIGTWGMGLVKLNTKNNSVEHFHYDSKNKNGFQSNSVKTILPDGNVLWIGTLDGGLFKLNFEKGSFTWTNFKNQKANKNSLSEDKVVSLLNDNAGNLWVGTFGGGLNKLLSEDKSKPSDETKFQHYYYQGNATGISNNIVTALCQDRRGFIWIGTYGGGLDRLNLKNNSFVNFKSDPNISTSLSKNDVLSIYEDASGSIWIGTHLGKGLNKLESNIEKFNHVAKDLSGKGIDDDVVWAIDDDKDSVLWIGTYKGGLNRWNRKTGKFSYFKSGSSAGSINDNHIRSIQNDGNFLFVGTYNGGLNILDKRTGKFKSFVNDLKDSSSIGANQIQSILIDKEKNYWFGTFGGGLNKLLAIDSRGKAKFKRFVYNPANPFSLNDNRVYTIYEDHEGVLWIGTFGGGLSRFDKKSERFIAYKNIPGDETSLSDNRVMSIFEDSKGSIWVGTYGGGLHKFDRHTEKFIRYNEKNKPNSSVVYGILEDSNNNLWMSTDNGLYKFNINSENFTRYDLHDGLQSLEFSGGAYLKSESGEMFFGGINGFNYFYPDSIKDNYFVPPVVISSVRVFNQPFRGERDTIKLSYDQNFLSLEFSALDYTNPQDNQYAFMLAGFDDEWRYVDSRNRTANFTNLSPGEYIFKVRGSNNDGVWNNVGAEIYLIISPPFWKTWWFISLSVLFTALVVYYMGSIRYRNLLAIEKIKTKLSADLHDNVGSGLTEISILSELTSKEVETVSPESSQRLNMISDKARQLVDNMSDIVWMINPQRDSLYHLMLRLKDSYSEFTYALGISFTAVNMEKFTEVKLPMDYRQNLFLIFKEAINNAVKHSKCKKIILEANLNKDALELSLKDDGIGIQYDLIKYGNGIQNMKSRANAIGGVLVVDSSGNGTIIKFNGKSSRFYNLRPFVK